METSWARVTADPSRKVYADRLSPDEWRLLQTSYRIGELAMPCCDGSAIPKTSPRGLQFFAHAAGECGSAPETIWHEQGKEAVATAARALGFEATIEKDRSGLWCADVWIESPGGPAVVEVQHSYQHLRDYLRRQERYRAEGVACVWLLPDENFTTLMRTQRSHAQRLRKVGPVEKTSHPDLPAACLRLGESPVVVAPDLACSLVTAVQALCERRWSWAEGRWAIDGVAWDPRFLCP